MLNGKGMEMLENMLRAVLHVLNGNIEGEEEGKNTHVGVQGRSTIDFVVVNKRGGKQ